MTTEYGLVHADSVQSPLEAIERIASSGGDIWESAVDAALAAADLGDMARWIIGDLALLVGKRYGTNRIDEFARSIGHRKSTVQEYRRVCAYWQKSTRVDFLDECPTIRWSHMRDAMRLKDLKQSVQFLRECADQNFTVEQAAVDLKKRLGKPVPPRKALDVEATLTGIRDNAVTFLVVDTLLPPALDAALREARPVRVVIYEIPSLEGGAA